MAWSFYFISMFPFKFLKYLQNSWLLGFDLSLGLAGDLHSRTTVLLPVSPVTSSTRGSYGTHGGREIWLIQEANVSIQSTQITWWILNQENPSTCHVFSTLPQCHPRPFMEKCYILLLHFSLCSHLFTFHSCPYMIAYFHLHLFTQALHSIFGLGSACFSGSESALGLWCSCSGCSDLLTYLTSIWS